MTCLWVDERRGSMPLPETFEKRLSTWTVETMKTVFGLTDSETHLGVVPTNNDRFGDYQCNAAMELARVLKKAPRQIFNPI